MLPGQPSRTMINTAVQRAAHQLLDNRPLIFVDPMAVGLVPEASETAILAAADRLRAPPARVQRSSMVLRSRFAEDRLEAAARRGVEQYVIVAAGLDTFPWRQPPWARDMRIFAVDMPASLDGVRACIRARGLAEPGNLTHVAADLETDDLAGLLMRHGFTADAPVYFSALGIVQFLTPAANDRLFMRAARAPAGSELVMSVHPPIEDLDGPAGIGLRDAIERGRGLGEPWLTLMRPGDVVARLGRCGFRDVFHLTTEAAQERYFGARTDGLGAGRGMQLISAIV